MANRTLNVEAGNGNWWRPCNNENKLLIGPEHTLHWKHYCISCSFVGKYGWKTVESYANRIFLITSWSLGSWDITKVFPYHFGAQRQLTICKGWWDAPRYQFCSFFFNKKPLTPPPLRFEHLVDFFLLKYWWRGGWGWGSKSYIS